ncbi:hypothetical protein LCER1_G007409 [Lachnellula cervina]|uniref:Uncharacterized protein n=1 Tax=Lachnellula cervina TaxID=1316786 RepID=A0A7D8YHW8_9HELO|nr:hypothetical protein LCER1_G007409 [Lachnellula cervina]
MDQLVQVVKAQNRYSYLRFFRLFVKVGGENSGVTELRLMVDVILRGECHLPSDSIDTHSTETFEQVLSERLMIPQATSEVINTTTSPGPRTWPVLDLPTVMNSKLGAFFARGGSNPQSKDYQDILFLVNKYMEPIYNIRSQLNATHR